MNEKHVTALHIQEIDNVATCISGGVSGTVATYEAGGKIVSLTLLDDIAFGHKFAVSPIAKGEQITKYGYPIGIATRDIAVGEHVHVHNVGSLRCN